MPKMVMLELTPEDMMKAIETLAEMLVSVKGNPNLIKIIPTNPQALVILILQRIIDQRQKLEGITAEESEADEATLEQSLKTFQEAMEKAAKK